MTYLGTDFETHAIWQGYVEDPAAKDFVARKARTIALTEQSANNQPYSRVWKSLGDSIPELYCIASRGIMSREKVSVRGFL